MKPRRWADISTQFLLSVVALATVDKYLSLRFVVGIIGYKPRDCSSPSYGSQGYWAMLNYCWGTSVFCSSPFFFKSPFKCESYQLMIRL